MGLKDRLESVGRDAGGGIGSSNSSVSSASGGGGGLETGSGLTTPSLTPSPLRQRAALSSTTGNEPLVLSAADWDFLAQSCTGAGFGGSEGKYMASPPVLLCGLALTVLQDNSTALHSLIHSHPSAALILEDPLRAPHVDVLKRLTTPTSSSRDEKTLFVLDASSRAFLASLHGSSSSASSSSLLLTSPSRSTSMPRPLTKRPSGRSMKSFPFTTDSPPTLLVLASATGALSTLSTLLAAGVEVSPLSLMTAAWTGAQASVVMLLNASGGEKEMSWVEEGKAPGDGSITTHAHLSSSPSHSNPSSSQASRKGSGYLSRTGGLAKVSFLMPTVQAAALADQAALLPSLLKHSVAKDALLAQALFSAASAPSPNAIRVLLKEPQAKVDVMSFAAALASGAPVETLNALKKSSSNTDLVLCSAASGAHLAPMPSLPDPRDGDHTLVPKVLSSLCHGIVTSPSLQSHQLMAAVAGQSHSAVHWWITTHGGFLPSSMGPQPPLPPPSARPSSSRARSSGRSSSRRRGKSSSSRRVNDAPPLPSVPSANLPVSSSVDHSLDNCLSPVLLPLAAALPSARIVDLLLSLGVPTDAATSIPRHPSALRDLLTPPSAPSNKSPSPLWTTTSPLVAASLRGQVGHVKALVEAGASPSAHAGNSDGPTPLWAASIAGRTSTVRTLLELGASIKPGPADPVLAAASTGSLPVLKILAQAGADMNYAPHPGALTPLIVAARAGHTAVVSWFLEILPSSSLDQVSARAGPALSAALTACSPTPPPPLAPLPVRPGKGRGRKRSSLSRGSHRSSGSAGSLRSISSSPTLVQLAAGPFDLLAKHPPPPPSRSFVPSNPGGPAPLPPSPPAALASIHALLAAGADPAPPLSSVGVAAQPIVAAVSSGSSHAIKAMASSGAPLMTAPGAPSLYDLVPNYDALATLLELKAPLPSTFPSTAFSLAAAADSISAMTALISVCASPSLNDLDTALRSAAFARADKAVAFLLAHPSTPTSLYPDAVFIAAAVGSVKVLELFPLDDTKNHNGLVSSALCGAALANDGNASVLDWLLIKYPTLIDLSAPGGPSSVPPLLYACHAGNNPAIIKLLESGASLLLPPSSEPTDSPASSRHNSPQKMEVPEGGDSYAPSSSHATSKFAGTVAGTAPLVAATHPDSLADISTVHLLLARGAQVDVNPRYTVTPLTQAVARGDLAMVQALIASGADLNGASLQWPTPVRQTPLGAAVSSRRHGLLQLLLDAGAIVDAPVYRGTCTPLMLAAQAGELRALRALLAAGADPEARADGPATALWVAAHNGQAKVIDELLASGANVEAPYKDYSVTPLWTAAQGGHCSAMSRLLSAGASALAAARDGQTPLWVAAQNGHSDAVSLLLTHEGGAAADLPAGEHGRPPAWIAAQHGHTDVLATLASFGRPVGSAMARDGSTPLFIAAQEGHVGTVAWLLGPGKARINASLKTGESALWIAAARGHLGVVRTLIAAGASVHESHDSMGASAVWIAAQEGHAGVVKALAEAGCALNEPLASHGITPLWVAAGRGHKDVVRVLLDHGADPRISSSSGGSPATVAAASGFSDLAIVLERASASPLLSRNSSKTSMSSSSSSKSYIQTRIKPRSRSASYARSR